MNIHNVKEDRTLYSSVPGHILLMWTYAVMCCGVQETQAQIKNDGPAVPSLTRWKIGNENAYAFDFEVSRGSEIPAFSSTHILGRNHGALAELYYIFGVTQGANTEKAPLRWDVVDQVLFCTRDVTHIAPPPEGVVLQRYPLIALVAGNDDGRWPLDRSKVPSEFNVNDGFPTPNYVACGPLAQALQGVHRGWKDDHPRVGDAAKVVHYDIRALDEKQVELYMTADAELYKWLYDSKTWKYKGFYPVAVQNEFLVLADGKSLVTEQSGKWCVIRNIEDASATCEAIVDRVEGEPLALVEDKVERTNFFLHRDRLLDDTGRELFTVRAPRDQFDRLRKIIDFVVDRRLAKP